MADAWNFGHLLLEIWTLFNYHVSVCLERLLTHQAAPETLRSKTTYRKLSTKITSSNLVNEKKANESSAEEIEAYVLAFFMEILSKIVETENS